MRVKPPNEMPALKGIFVGGCIERGEGSSFRARAHAHCSKGDPYFGWVCVRSVKRLPALLSLSDMQWDATLAERPNRLLYHEYAHILAPNHVYHDDVWRRRMKELGQSIPKRYQKNR